MFMSFEVVQDNITNLNVDAIVNSANKSLIKGSGICKTIYEEAGEKLLDNYIKENYGDLILNSGEAIITPGFNLSAKFIIHTVTPKYYIGIREDNIRNFSSCYVSIIKYAKAYKIKSVAIPCIGNGHHGWPLHESIAILLDTLQWLDCMLDDDLKIYFVCNTKQQYLNYKGAVSSRRL